MSATLPTVIGGRYRVVRLLGEGSFGRVLEVADANTGGRFALKLLHAMDPRKVQAFRREALAANAVANGTSHVARVTDADIDPKHGAFIVMELLDGDTLARRVAAAGPMSPEAALSVLREVAHALDAAHELGIVHCDIKPENVFLARTREASRSEKVYVLDFGVAKLRSDAHSRAPASTAVGTPPWMPPERFDGEALPQSDVFSFALLAYFLLVGRMLPRAQRLTACAVAASVGVSLPAAFDPWIARATHEQPRERFESAGHAWRALESALLGRATPVAGRPSPVPDAAPSSRAPAAPRPAQRRSPWRAVRSALVFTALALSLGVAMTELWPWIHRSEPIERAPIARAPIAPTPIAPAPIAPTVVSPLPAPESAALEPLLIQWSTSVWSPTMSVDRFRQIYMDPVMVRPVSRNSLPLSQLYSSMRQLYREQRGITFDVTRYSVEREDLSRADRRASANAVAACGEVPIWTVRVQAHTSGYACSRADGRRFASGEYIVRVRRDSLGALRICYEAWSDTVDRQVCLH